MEYTGGGGGAVLSGGNVPAFLTKLWTLVEDPDTDPLICWSPGGTSFHVYDEGRFSKEVLPKFFKHNNMASFIRQLNMYGFRKVIHIEQGGLLKPERDDTEFHHPFFLRGQEHLLENIKRKVTNVSAVQEVKATNHDVNKILNDVQLMKGKQETIDSRINSMKHENEALWREVASLRQKHVQQQKVVNKLIHFLVSLVQTNRVLGVKRKLPLMLNDSGSSHSMPKYSRPLSLEHIQAAASLFSADSPVSSGPIISDVTDVASPTADCVVCDWTDAGDGLSVNIKEEPSNPEGEACPVLEGGGTPITPGGTPITPLSPTTFINSILEEKASPPPPNTSSLTPGPGPSSQAVSSSDSDPDPTKPQQSCQTIACIDRPLPPPSTGGLSPDVWHFLSTRPEKSELSSHVDSIDSGLENLQGYLNTQTFAFDTSPLMEFFSSSPCPSGDFDLDCLDTLLADDVSNGGAESSNMNTGKQLVQYTPTPMLASEPISSAVVDLPSLLEAESFSSSAPPTDDISHHPHLDSDL